MNRSSFRFPAILAVALSPIALAMSPLRANAAPGDTTIYAGEPLASAQLDAAPWGTGAVADTDLVSPIEKGHSLDITTNGPYQGAILTFHTPIPMGDMTTDKTKYLVLNIYQTAGGATPTGPAPIEIGESLFHVADYVAQVPGQYPGQYPGQGMPPGGMPPGAMPPGGMPPGGMPPDQNAAPAAPPPPAISDLRIVVTTVTGATAEYTRALPIASDSATWTKIGIPLSAIPLKAAQAVGAQIKSITITGDAAGQLYVGGIQVVSDTTPITASIVGDNTVTAGSALTFTTDARGGVAGLKYDWALDDANTSDAITPSFTHAFQTAGTYHLKLTVSDADGIKAPVSKTMNVLVEAQ